MRPVWCAAIRVEPEPPNGSSTMVFVGALDLMARSIMATGFGVACPCLSAP